MIMPMQGLTLEMIRTFHSERESSEMIQVVDNIVSYTKMKHARIFMFIIWVHLVKDNVVSLVYCKKDDEIDHHMLSQNYGGMFIESNNIS